MQSICDQIDQVWTGYDDLSLTNGEAEKVETRRSIASRDFMVTLVPSHELSSQEETEARVVGAEAKKVMREWQAKSLE